MQACKSAGDISEEELVKLIASVESDSTHPIAKAVVNYAKNKHRTRNRYRYERICRLRIGSNGRRNTGSGW